MNYKKRITEILNQWKADNNLNGDYIAHHRDDTEECREYNKAHYNRWGFNEDNTKEVSVFYIKCIKLMVGLQTLTNLDVRYLMEILFLRCNLRLFV